MLLSNPSSREGEKKNHLYDKTEHILATVALKRSRLRLSGIYYILYYIYYIYIFFIARLNEYIDSPSLCPPPPDRRPVRTTLSVALATFSQWPHQRPTQKNRNDRLFIIAQPLCRRGKSIIKTRLTAKITAVSSIVLERANFFFFLKGLLTSPASPWCNLLPISNPIAFWNWIYLTHSHGEWTLPPVKKRERFCVKLPKESEGFGFVRYRSLSAINLPTGRMSSLQGRTGGLLSGVGVWGGSELDSETREAVRKRMGILATTTSARNEPKEEADSHSFGFSWQLSESVVQCSRFTKNSMKHHQKDATLLAPSGDKEQTILMNNTFMN